MVLKLEMNCMNPNAYYDTLTHKHLETMTLVECIFNVIAFAKYFMKL